MNATDELRRLLDERGVEHFDGCENTLWGYEQTSESTGIYRYSADEISGGFVNVWLHHCTPEQAIAATLGQGTCHNKGYVYCSERYFVCSSCGCEFDYSNFACEFAEHRSLGSPHYCPNCGRKVVDDG